MVKTTNDEGPPVSPNPFQPSFDQMRQTAVSNTGGIKMITIMYMTAANGLKASET